MIVHLGPRRTTRDVVVACRHQLHGNLRLARALLRHRSRDAAIVLNRRPCNRPPCPQGNKRGARLPAHQNPQQPRQPESVTDFRSRRPPHQPCQTEGVTDFRPCQFRLPRGVTDFRSLQIPRQPRQPRGVTDFRSVRVPACFTRQEVRDRFSGGRGSGGLLQATEGSGHGTSELGSGQRLPSLFAPAGPLSFSRISARAALSRFRPGVPCI